jgi:Fe-S cluster biogenesis protein NfuA
MMPSGSTAREVSRRIEGLLAQLDEVADPAARDTAEELARAIVELYGAGLERITAVIAGQPGGVQLIHTLAEDDVVASLFVLHDLHPVPLAERVGRALDTVRSQAGSRTLEFLAVDGHGVARIAVRGGGCRSSAGALTSAIERAVQDAAPELAGVDIEQEGSGPVLLQIQAHRGGGPPG